MTDVAYPFSALVGSDDLCLALLLNAVSPAIGGVLVRGEKGTAKSTAVRGLAALLPTIAVIEECRYACDPEAPDDDCPDGPHQVYLGEGRPVRLIELPVGASEDRVAGSLDLERALVEGERAFEPGLLADAHRGVLYVDEVNLLGDHLVDLLLDAAAMGRNIVEREGVSVRHAARFQLVGTMNPEEGELRPQLLDRFGLTVQVHATRDLALRAEVVRRRLAYELDPIGFAQRWAEADGEIAWKIRAARALLPGVVLGEASLNAVVRACAVFEVDGMRGDIVTAKAAVALAAWEGRTDVTLDDVRRAALLALPHRRRRGPFDPPGIDEETLDRALQDPAAAGEEPEPDPDPPRRPPPPPPGGGQPLPQREAAAAPPDRTVQLDKPAAEPQPAPSQPTSLPAGATFDTVLLALHGKGSGAAGRRSAAAADRGAHVGARVPGGAVRDLALAATLRAAAPHQRTRGASTGRLAVRGADLREKVREGREGNLVLFAVDASGSMAARRRMTAVKGAVLSLLLDAYQRRDRVGLITFRGSDADLVVPPTASVDLAARLLEDLPTGGRTPLAAGITAAAAVVATERVRDPRRRPLVVLVTDGRCTTGPDPVQAAGLLSNVASVVVDTEDGWTRLGLAGRLADAMGAPWLQLEDLGGLAGLVRAITVPVGAQAGEAGSAPRRPRPGVRRAA